MEEFKYKKDCEDFRESGLLWFVNTMLHAFGWAIHVRLDEDGEIYEFFPRRVAFRGFSEKHNTKGYQKVSKFLQENIDTLVKESLE